MTNGMPKFVQRNVPVPICVCFQMKLYDLNMDWICCSITRSWDYKIRL